VTLSTVCFFIEEGMGINPTLTLSPYHFGKKRGYTYIYMGGYGSTRWRLHYKKSLVEECYSLDILDFRRQGILDNLYYKGYNVWFNKLTGDVFASINVEVEVRQNGEYVVHLRYTASNIYWEELIDIPVLIGTSRSYFRGYRKWFICPLTVNGVWCARRVRKLYLPRGEKYFGCRHCHQLTYRSCQEHGKRW